MDKLHQCERTNFNIYLTIRVKNCIYFIQHGDIFITFDLRIKKYNLHKIYTLILKF